MLPAAGGLAALLEIATPCANVSDTDKLNRIESDESNFTIVEDDDKGSVFFFMLQVFMVITSYSQLFRFDMLFVERRTESLMKKINQLTKTRRLWLTDSIKWK